MGRNRKGSRADAWTKRAVRDEGQKISDSEARVDVQDRQRERLGRIVGAVRKGSEGGEEKKAVRCERR